VKIRTESESSRRGSVVWWSRLLATNKNKIIIYSLE